LLVEKLKVISSFNNVGPYNIYQTKVSDTWAKKIVEFMPKQRKYQIILEIKKRGKFFHYKVSSMVQPRIENWDNLPKDVRKQIKRSYLEKALEDVSISQQNTNSNIIMEESNVKNNQGSS
jgi:hypothetical protein